MTIQRKCARGQRTVVPIAMACALCAISCSSRPQAAAGPRILDDLGAVHAPLDLDGERAAVFIVAGIECPISNGYAPEINRLCAEYTKQQVKFYIIYPDSDLSAEAARAHARSYGIQCPVLMDPWHELTRILGATVTPEAVIAGSGGKILYRGRIDDLYITLGHRRYEPRTHDLKEALDAVLAGRPVAKPRTDAVGCSIST